MRSISFYPLVFILLLCFSCSKPINEPEKPVNVIVVQAEKKEVKPSRQVVGQIVPITKVQLRSRITGFVEKQYFNNGSAVRKGDVLFTIQKTQYEAQVLAAQGKLEQAQAELENVTINYNRQKYLASRSAVSQREFDLAAAQLKNAEGGVKLAQADLINTQLNLSYTQIIAPFDGVIGITKFYPGNLVFPSSEPMIDIVMLDPILVEFNIVEQDILDYLEKKINDSSLIADSNIEVLNKQVSIFIKMSNGKLYPLPGEIYYFDNTIDPMVGAVLIRAIFNNPSKILLPGAYATVIIESKNFLNTLVIPQEAVQTDQLGNYVYIINSKSIVLKKRVKLGASYGNFISVKSGLLEGALVVCEGILKIHEGLKVDTETVSYDKLNLNSKTGEIEKPAWVKQFDNNLKNNIPSGVMSAEIQGNLSPEMQALVKKEIENGYIEMKSSIQKTEEISDDNIVRTDIGDGILTNIREKTGDVSPKNSVK